MSEEQRWERPIVLGEKVDVLRGGEWAKEKMVVKVHDGPRYDVDVSDKKSVIVLKEKGPDEVRAYGPVGSVVPRWSGAEIEALTAAELRHVLKVMSVPGNDLKKKAQLAMRLKELMPQAVEAPQPSTAERASQLRGSEEERSSKRPRLKKDAAEASSAAPSGNPDLSGLDSAIARLWWVMAKHGSNNSDGEPAHHMWKDQTWHHGNFTVHYKLMKDDGHLATFEVTQRDGAPLPPQFLDAGSAASAIVEKVETAVIDSYNDIIACTNGKWPTDHETIHSCLPNKPDDPVYSDRKRFLEGLFSGQFTDDEGGSNLALDTAKGVLTFTFVFRGDASNGNDWVPHRLRPYVFPNKDASYDREAYRKESQDFRHTPSVHRFADRDQRTAEAKQQHYSSFGDEDY